MTSHETTIETVKGIATSVADVAKSAVVPTPDPKAEPDPEAVAEKTNEQVYRGGDAAVAPEAVPAPASLAPPAKKTVKKTAKKKSKKSKR